MIIPSPANGKSPNIDEKAFIAPDVTIIGDVEIGSGTNVWPGVVIRAAICSVKIGKNCSIQDNCVIHSEAGTSITIGDNVLIAHGALIHGPGDISDGALVGIGAIKLQGKNIAEGALVGSGAVVTKDVGVRKKVVGNPAREIGDVSDAEHAGNQASLSNYASLGKKFRKAGLDQRKKEN